MIAGNGVLAAGDLIEHVTPVTLWTFRVGGYPVEFTNHMFMVAVSAALMLLVFPIIAGQSKRSPVPTGLRNFFEAIMSFADGRCSSGAGGAYGSLRAAAVDGVFFHFVQQPCGDDSDHRDH